MKDLLKIARIALSILFYLFWALSLFILYVSSTIGVVFIIDLLNKP